MVKVKICGITNIKDALVASQYGTDAIGFVFFKKSKRYVEPHIARSISSQIPPFVTKVGVFVNEDPKTVLEIMSYCHLDLAQLHGDESPNYCRYIGENKAIKVFRIKDKAGIDKIKAYIGAVKSILLDTFSEDTFGGTGKSFNWEIGKKITEKFNLPVILSGGLNPDNIVSAIKEVSPYGVDVSSGVEIRPGIKDAEKIARFIKLAKCTDNVYPTD